MGSKNTKNWVVWAAVATALLLIPRRSSRKADAILSDKKNVDADKDYANNNDTNNKDTPNNDANNKTTLTINSHVD